MKASDLSTELILIALAKYQGQWATWDSEFGIDIKRECGYADIPKKLWLAKMRNLIDKRELVSGCSCGCRGDYEITDKGLAHIGTLRNKPFTGY